MNPNDPKNIERYKKIKKDLDNDLSLSKEDSAFHTEYEKALNSKTPEEQRKIEKALEKQRQTDEAAGKATTEENLNNYASTQHTVGDRASIKDQVKNDLSYVKGSNLKNTTVKNEELEKNIQKAGNNATEVEMTPEEYAKRGYEIEEGIAAEKDRLNNISKGLSEITSVKEINKFIDKLNNGEQLSKEDKDKITQIVEQDGVSTIFEGTHYTVKNNKGKIQVVTDHSFMKDPSIIGASLLSAASKMFAIMYDKPETAQDFLKDNPKYQQVMMEKEIANNAASAGISESSTTRAEKQDAREKLDNQRFYEQKEKFNQKLSTYSKDTQLKYEQLQRKMENNEALALKKKDLELLFNAAKDEQELNIVMKLANSNIDLKHADKLQAVIAKAPATAIVALKKAILDLEKDPKYKDASDRLKGNMFLDVLGKTLGVIGQGVGIVAQGATIGGSDKNIKSFDKSFGRPKSMFGKY